jgi:ABC-2 type transport system permease protein
MSLPAVFAKTLSDQRWQVFWYGLGLASLAAIVVYLYPSYSEQMADFEIPEALQGFMGEAGYTTPEGFISAEFFSFAPAVLCIFAIMAATAALGGEEATGTLDMLLAQSISRRRLLFEKIAGLAVSTLAILAVTALGWLMSVPFVDIDISYTDLFLATANIAPLLFAVEAVSLWATAAFPERKMATGLVTLGVIVSYFAAYLAEVVDSLAFLRWISVFHYHDGTNALTHGLNPAGTAVLLGMSVLFVALAAVAFERREIGVNRDVRWPFFRRSGEPA